MNDQTAAANLEITAQLAEAAEDILRDFANNAELDVALIVDHSGALIAGISADDDVHIDTVSALVAGTIGSIRALGKAVGESKSLESTHHGEDFIIYLRELSTRFIIVGVAVSDIPAGILREVAARISNPLLELLSNGAIEEKEEAKGETADAAIASAVKPIFDLTDTDSPEASEEVEDIDKDTRPEEVEEITDPSPDPVEETVTEVEAEIEDEEPTAESEVPPAAPIANSPFEFVTEEEDEDDLPSLLEAEEEAGADLESKAEEPIAQENPLFEIGKDEAGADSESTVEEPTLEEKPLFEIGKKENDEAEIENDSDESVSAPLLVSPAMSRQTISVSSDDDDDESDDDSHGVAAISVPIATEFAKKIESSNLERKSTPPPLIDEDKETEDEEEEDPPQSTGGPRYVFDIG